MNNHWENILGWFDFEDIYNEAVNRLKDGDTIVEIGTFLGKSTCYLAQRIKESGKKINLKVCDIYYFDNEDPGKINVNLPTGSFYPLFLENIKKQGVEDVVKSTVANTFDFVNTFENESIDFLFLDDNHLEEYLYDELNVWYPKVKKGGIIAGHDINSFYVFRAVERFCTEKNLDFHLNNFSYIINEVK